MPGRHLIFSFLAAGASTLLAAALPAAAQQSAPAPSQLNIIVGFAAGGSADSIARIVGNRMGEILGQKVVIENRPGAGANIAAKTVIAAPSDGMTLLATTAALPINNTLYKNKGFEITDLKPVSISATTPEVIVVNKANPAKTLKEFIANSQGKKVTFSSAGVGTGSHIVAEFFFRTVAKLDVTHVPFRGGPDALAALMGGHVDFNASSLSGIAGQVQSGDVRGIAIATAARFPAVPDVPTYTEGGFPGHIWSSWAGFFTSSKSPDAIVASHNRAIVAALKEKEIDERLRKIGFAPMSGELKESQEFFKSELDQWGKMVRTLGMSVD